MNALVLAFDGLVADTLELRAAAIVDALRVEHIDVAHEATMAALAGRSLHESISALVGDEDPTLVDLAALRAQQDVSRRMAQGVSLTRNARDFLERERVNGTRLVLRADSPRRDVERVLQLTDLEMAFAFVRCADDVPRARGVSTLEGSYAAISQRLDALRVTQRQAIEYDTLGVEVATRLIGSARLAQRLSVEAPGR